LHSRGAFSVTLLPAPPGPLGIFKETGGSHSCLTVRPTPPVPVLRFNVQRGIQWVCWQFCESFCCWCSIGIALLALLYWHCSTIVFTITLAFGFILSGNLDGIDKIRDGAGDMANSIVSSFQHSESNVTTEFEQTPSAISTYVNQTNAKYLLIAAVLVFGLFMASLVGAGILGFVAGILFSPEIASVPFLAQAAVAISDTVSTLWSDLIAKLAAL